MKYPIQIQTIIDTNITFENFTEIVINIFNMFMFSKKNCSINKSQFEFVSLTWTKFSSFFGFFRYLKITFA